MATVLRLAGNAAADHQHHAELAQRVRERQHQPPTGCPARRAAARCAAALCQRVSPQHAAASRTSCGIASNARCIGWIANGRLKMTEATSRPSKREHERVAGRAPRTSRPSGDARAHRHQQVVAEHGRRQHQRQREQRLDQRPAPAKSRVRRARARATMPTRQRGSRTVSSGELERQQQRGPVHRRHCAGQGEAVAREDPRAPRAAAGSA